MKRKIVYSIFLIMITFNLKAEGYRINIQWQGMNDSTIFLAHYYDSKVFINDTLQLDTEGKATVMADTLLPEGLYMLYQSQHNYFDFLLGSDQSLSIKTNQDNIFEHLDISGAEESEQFLTFQKVLKNNTDQKKALIEKTKSSDQGEAQKAREALNELDKSMIHYMENEIRNAGKTMYGAFINASNQIIIPDPPVAKDHPKYDSIAWFHSYFYQRDHFLENIDFTDDRLIYTPLLKPKMDRYFNNILLQSPDSIIPQALKTIRKAEPNKNMYRYVTQYLINNSAQSKIMGMDAVFVAIADEVYLKGKAFWADSLQTRKIAEEAYLSRPNLIGKQAPELVMENIEGEEESLYNSQAEFTILAFYEYDCGHCKKDIPALYNDVYLKNIDKNIDVYLVCMNDNKEKWQKFVEENELVGWHHLWDPLHHSKFRFKYNVKTAPTIYLLDQDMKIVAKRLDNTSLSKLLNVLFQEK